MTVSSDCSQWNKALVRQKTSKAGQSHCTAPSFASVTYTTIACYASHRRLSSSHIVITCLHLSTLPTSHSTGQTDGPNPLA
ncbi:hypothetical protein KZY62_08260 [Prevotella denticola]|uniref:hypothetical protein n=1 Tax=Prevotella denticola TaxID=28129 RepID=UPI001C5CE78F|nr:hypothetical protein [Prevotella denticola]MBW4898588.1 hypothetical protein [Prevotella denticola]